jgi:hypothetical protein
MTAERERTVLSRGRWLLPVVVAVALGSAACQPAPPPAATNSYYMAKATPADASQLGCFNANRSGRMTLFFGAPVAVGGHYGATLWAAPDRDTAGITQTVQSFIRGWAYCRTNPNLRILVGIGTSNSTIDHDSTAWLTSHGRAWGSMAGALSRWAARWYPGFAQVFGAWDFEPSWSSFAKADAWLNGYGAAPGRPLLFVNASADGCPTTTATNGPCNNGWNQQMVWHLAWQHHVSIPMPQIYATSGVNAHQWQLIDLWATVNKKDRMLFFGNMSQLGACRQTGSCPKTNNNPQTANAFLRWWLNTDRRTAQAGVSSMTDVRWNS